MTADEDGRQAWIDRLGDFAETLRHFDGATLAAATGALGLLPENCDHLLRLDLLAAVVVAAAPAGSTPMSNARLRRTFKESPIADISHLEDPCENFLTEPMAFYGGSYMVFPGVIEDASFGITSLMKAVFAPGDGSLTKTTRRRLLDLCGSVLCMSQLVAERAGLGRYVEPRRASSSGVYVPPAIELAALVNAVKIPKTEATDFIARRGFDSAALTEITSRPGDISITQAAEVSNPELGKRPLLDTGDSLVVLSPGSLLAALRHHVLRIANDNGELHLVASRVRHVMTDAARQFIGHFRLDELTVDLPDPPTEFDEALFHLDVNRLLYLQVVSDPLTDFSAAELFDAWDSSALLEAMSVRASAIDEHLHRANPGLVEVLVVVSYAMVGRESMLLLPENGLSSIFLGVADLETLSLLEGHDPLFLLKFARADKRLRATSEVLCLDPMNEFGMYRARDYSFYMSDDAPPTMLHITEGFKGGLHREIRRKRDPHPVRWRNRNVAVVVMRLHDDMAMPIYVPFPPPSNAAEFFVEAHPSIWVRALQPDWVGFERGPRLAFQFGETIAYWMWQFAPHLAGLYQAGTYDHVLIDVNFADSSAPAEEGVAEFYRLEASADGGGIHVDVLIDRTFEQAMFSADNTRERGFIRALLDVVLSEAGLRVAANVLDQWLDEIAPIGQKRMMASFDMSRKPQMEPGHLPKPRRLQQPDLNVVDDSFVEWVAKPMGLDVGPIQDEKRIEVLNYFVDACFRRLRELLMLHDDDQVTSWCVQAYESLVRERALQEATLATQIACYGAYKDFAVELAKHIPISRGSELAARFLIEISAAERSTGAAAMSQCAYDELLALAYAIVNRGLESDMLRFKITDIPLSVLGSGRLGGDRQNYASRLGLFLDQSAGLDVKRSGNVYAGHWKEIASGEVDPELEAAFEAEFGMSATDTYSMYWAIHRAGAEMHGECKTLPVRVLVDRIVKDLGCDFDVAQERLRSIALVRRSKFEDLPDGFATSDLMPWRFNRSLSYLRRPLLWNDEMSRVSWGSRNLMDALSYLGVLVSSGRIRAKSAEMKAFVTKIRRRDTEAFNDRVAATFEGRSDIVVRRRVAKIGRQRLVDASGQALGDIDVLVAQPKKRRVLAIECKDFGGARTPNELSNELKEVFHGEKSVLRKHTTRAAWLQERIDDVLEWLELKQDTKRRWRVEAAIVVDRELFSPFLVDTTLPVVPFGALPSWFD